MLDLRPSCEHCDADLPPWSLDARICTFECTFCAACTDDLLGGVCPNCTGELVRRPARPHSLLDGAPGSADRVHSPVDLESHRVMLNGRVDGDDAANVVLRRYVDAWRGGDLTALVDCYHDEFTLHYDGSSRFAGTHRGRESALAVMAEVSTLAPRELLAVEHVLVEGRTGALVVRERLTRDGESTDVTRTLLYEVRDGRLATCRLLEHDQAAVDRMWR